MSTINHPTSAGNSPSISSEADTALDPVERDIYSRQLSQFVNDCADRYIVHFDTTPPRANDFSTYDRICFFLSGNLEEAYPGETIVNLASDWLFSVFDDLGKLFDNLVSEHDKLKTRRYSALVLPLLKPRAELIKRQQEAADKLALVYRENVFPHNAKKLQGFLADLLEAFDFFYEHQRKVNYEIASDIESILKNARDRQRVLHAMLGSWLTAIGVLLTSLGVLISIWLAV